MKEIKAPNKVSRKSTFGKETLFLAGSIEMGKAEPWQAKIVDALKDVKDLFIFNPRRDNWDPSWKQETTNYEFVRQVKWEREGLEQAGITVFYFDPETISPITLLELGRYGPDANSCCVCCPPEYFRRGNVEIFCEDNNIELVNTLNELIDYIKNELDEDQPA